MGPRGRQTPGWAGSGLRGLCGLRVLRLGACDRDGHWVWECVLACGQTQLDHTHWVPAASLPPGLPLPTSIGFAHKSWPRETLTTARQVRLPCPGSHPAAGRCHLSGPEGCRGSPLVPAPAPRSRPHLQQEFAGGCDLGFSLGVRGERQGEAEATEPNTRAWPGSASARVTIVPRILASGPRLSSSVIQPGFSNPGKAAVSALDRGPKPLLSTGPAAAGVLGDAGVTWPLRHLPAHLQVRMLGPTCLRSGYYRHSL